jgi:RimJ/RimL family protein N-acetyltransferase
MESGGLHDPANRNDMTEVVIGQDDRVGRYVSEGLNDVESLSDFGNFVTIGIEKDGKIIAGAVYNNMRSNGGVPFDMHIAFYASNPAWATRSNMEAVLGYPFEHLKLKRITAIVRKSNKKVKKLISSLGFQYEGKARIAWDGKNDAFIYGMLKEESEMCLENLKDNSHGRR